MSTGSKKDSHNALHHMNQPDIIEVLEIEQRLLLVLETVSDGICFVDKQDQIIYANKIFSVITKIPSEQLIGENIHTFLELPVGEWNPSELKYVYVDNQFLYMTIKPLTTGTDNSGYIIFLHKSINHHIHDAAEKLKIAETKAVYLEKKLRKIKETSWYPERYTIGESSEQQLLRKMKCGFAFEKFIGVHAKVIEALEVAAKAAKVRSTVLIHGKSGTGKELIAEGIHNSSPRKQGPFIKINCAAIPAGLLESELFGHEKGAFTGAIKKKLGKYELANHGTLFLDEIGEMDMSMQTKLLRVLQNNSFERVGGEETITVDIRIIAATNRNIDKMVRAGTFREDLYYRLNVIPISLPDLKERKDDIPLLINYYLKIFSEDFDKQLKGITNSAINILMNYDWPGNVRELKNIMERMVVLGDGDYLDIHDVPPTIRHQIHTSETPNDLEWLYGSLITEKIFPLEEYEKQIIKVALERYQSFTAAGKVLGIDHKTVAAKAQKYGLLQKLNNWINN